LPFIRKQQDGNEAIARCLDTRVPRRKTKVVLGEGLPHPTKMNSAMQDDRGLGTLSCSAN